MRHHSIDYVEFTVSNIEDAKTFYGQVFGWEFNDYGPEYAGIKGPEREVGGFTKGAATPGTRTPLVVLFSNDLQATQSAVTKAGGEVTKAIFSFPGGKRFHFRDPFSNVLAVWAEL